MMIFKIITVALLTVGFWMHGAYADRLYTWTDDKGVIHITKQPPPQKAKADNVIDYTPQTTEQIRAIRQPGQVSGKLKKPFILHQPPITCNPIGNLFFEIPETHFYALSSV
jgi:hypothetical protein